MVHHRQKADQPWPRRCGPTGELLPNGDRIWDVGFTDNDGTYVPGNILQTAGGRVLRNLLDEEASFILRYSREEHGVKHSADTWGDLPARGTMEVPEGVEVDAVLCPWIGYQAIQAWSLLHGDLQLPGPTPDSPPVPQEWVKVRVAARMFNQDLARRIEGGTFVTNLMDQVRVYLAVYRHLGDSSLAFFLFHAQPGQTLDLDPIPMPNEEREFWTPWRLEGLLPPIRGQIVRCIDVLGRTAAKAGGGKLYQCSPEPSGTAPADRPVAGGFVLTNVAEACSRRRAVKLQQQALKTLLSGAALPLNAGSPFLPFGGPVPIKPPTPSSSDLGNQQSQESNS